jgi:hypothetical protein
MDGEVTDKPMNILIANVNFSINGPRLKFIAGWNSQAQNLSQTRPTSISLVICSGGGEMRIL